MNDRMSAKEYQRLIVKPSVDAVNSNWKKQKEETKKVLPGDEFAVNEFGFYKRLIKKARSYEEDELTMKVAEYLEVLKTAGKVQCYSHIPNNTFTKYQSVKRKNTAMGVRAGVPDMLIVFQDKVLFLELKRLKGGVLSPFQKEWVKALAHTEKVSAMVAAGWDEAKRAIDLHLK